MWESRPIKTTRDSHMPNHICQPYMW
jgi:hypothetical protein